MGGEFSNRLHGDGGPGEVFSGNWDIRPVKTFKQRKHPVFEILRAEGANVIELTVHFFANL